MIGAELEFEHAPVADLVQPFQLDIPGLRGRLVRLGPVLDAIIARHGYPAPVACLLAETITATVLLASLLKYRGVFSLQAKGNGAVRLVVADVTSAGDVRAYAQFDADRLPEMPDTLPLMRPLLGEGYLAFTVDQGDETERYQGIVSLEGNTLTDAVRHYFEQSEQLETQPAIFVEQHNGKWHGGGIILQRLAEEDRIAMPDPVFEEAWRRNTILLATVTPEELMGTRAEKDLGPLALLYRLFHEEQVRIFPPSAVRERCRCSEGRVRGVMEALPPEELDQLRVDGTITVTCEFCNRHYTI